MIILKKVLKVEQIQKYYGNKDNITKAIDGISFDVLRESIILHLVF